MAKQKPNTGKVVKKKTTKKPAQSQEYMISLSDILEEDFNRIAKATNGFTVDYHIAKKSEEQLTKFESEGKSFDNLTPFAQRAITQADKVLSIYEKEQSQLINNQTESITEMQKAKIRELISGKKVLQAQLEQRGNDYLEAEKENEALRLEHKNLEAQLEEAHLGVKKAIGLQAELIQIKTLYQGEKAVNKRRAIEMQALEERLAKADENDSAEKIIAKEDYDTVVNELKQQIKEQELEIADGEKQIEVVREELANVVREFKGHDEVLKQQVEKNKALEEQLAEGITDEEVQKMYETKLEAQKAMYEKLERDLQQTLAERNSDLETANEAIGGLQEQLGIQQKLQYANKEEKIEDMESVVEGEEYSVGEPEESIERGYAIHPEFGLISVEEIDSTIIRYKPGHFGTYIVNIDTKERIHVGKDYAMFVDKHEANIEAHLQGNDRNYSDWEEDLPSDAEE